VILDKKKTNETIFLPGQMINEAAGSCQKNMAGTDSHT